jgi:phosphoribosylaminoimidazole-succinocarboxamide synthase
MIPKALLEENIKNCLNDTLFLNLPNRRQGKVRDIYDLGDKLVIITTDRLSAFDRVLALIPFKGQVLNLVSNFWFKNTTDIIKNAVIEMPDPNVLIMEKCKVIPVEVIVRGYLTGSTDTSVWMQYSKGIRNICGNILPDGMKKNQKFEKPILTPTTKSEYHDKNITPDEIVSSGLVEKDIWEKIEKIAFALFDYGTKIAEKNGLILVDTKYEFGINSKGEILLIDELHTPDSSRFWIKKTYEQRISENKEPENIDKEFLRLWFKEHCDPYNDKVLPEAPKELVIELSSRYITLYEMITGKGFIFDDIIPIKDRLICNLRKYINK